jgi:hypothetical protein
MGCFINCETIRLQMYAQLFGFAIFLQFFQNVENSVGEVGLLGVANIVQTSAYSVSEKHSLGNPLPFSDSLTP